MQERAGAGIGRISGKRLGAAACQLHLSLWVPFQPSYLRLVSLCGS